MIDHYREYDRKTKTWTYSFNSLIEHDEHDMYQFEALSIAEDLRDGIKDKVEELLKKNEGATNFSTAKIKILNPKIDAFIEQLMDLIEIEAQDRRNFWKMRKEQVENFYKSKK